MEGTGRQALVPKIVTPVWERPNHGANHLQPLPASQSFRLTRLVIRPTPQGDYADRYAISTSWAAKLTRADMALPLAAAS